MTRCCLWIGAGVFTLCASSVSFAQGQPCSDGSWFCDSNASESTDAPSDAPSTVLIDEMDDSEFTSSEQPAQSSEQRRAKRPSAGEKKRANQGKSAGKTRKRARPKRSTVVVYQNAAPSSTVVIVQPYPKAAFPAPPPKPKPLRYRTWGMNVRLSGAAFEGDHATSGMGGIGMGVRARPVPVVAVELGCDFIGGRDYYGHRRIELPVSASTILYVNPRKPVQFYMLGGFFWSSAFVRDLYNDNNKTYAYLGGQFGPGLELRFSPGVSGNVDIIGFVRGRVDSNTRRDPEFKDYSTGRYSNSSGGALFRAGLTAYF